MENIKIILPISNNEVELKPYITARDKRAIRDVLLGAANISPTGMGVTSVNPAVINLAEDKMFELIIVSIAGVVDDKLEKVMNLQGQDYDFLLKKVTEISEGLPIEKKT